MHRDQEIAATEKDWAENPRWKNVKRPYSAEDVIRLRGSIDIEHTPARLGAFQTPADEAANKRPHHPTVFVSYVSEDVRFAEKLVESLKAHGIKPWFDKEELRFIERWDTEIEDTIGKKVDFILVLLSRNFGDGVESHVHLELEKAFERKSKRGAVKFIYALLIDERARHLDALDRAKIQVTRLLDLASDVPILVADIWREFAKLSPRQP